MFTQEMKEKDMSKCEVCEGELRDLGKYYVCQNCGKVKNYKLYLYPSEMP